MGIRTLMNSFVLEPFLYFNTSSKNIYLKLIPENNNLESLEISLISQVKTNAAQGIARPLKEKGGEGEFNRVLTS